MARPRTTGARCLVGGALLLRRCIRCARLGCRRRVGRPRVSRVLPLRRAPDGSVARSRIAPPLRVAPRRRPCARLRRPRYRRRDLGSSARDLRLGDPCCPGPPRLSPGTSRRDPRQHARHPGGGGGGNRHDQAQADGKHARARRCRCCRRWNRCIWLGCCENGCFCGNCSTSSLRRIYSFFAHKALTNRYGQGLTGLKTIPGPTQGTRRTTADDCGTVRPVSAGLRTRGGSLVPTTTAASARARAHSLAVVALSGPRGSGRRPEGAPLSGRPRGRQADPSLPARNVALAGLVMGGRRTPSLARGRDLTRARVQGLGAQPLEAPRAPGVAHCGPSATPRRLALHPPLRGRVDRSERVRHTAGLQMDLGFQRTYGRELLRRKGTANHWTPLEQMWVAERAHRSGPRLLPVAQHGEVLRTDLESTSWDEARDRSCAGRKIASARRKSATGKTQAATRLRRPRPPKRRSTRSPRL